MVTPVRDISCLNNFGWEYPSQTWAMPSGGRLYKRTWRKQLLLCLLACPCFCWRFPTFKGGRAYFFKMAMYIEIQLRQPQSQTKKLLDALNRYRSIVVVGIVRSQSERHSNESHTCIHTYLLTYIYVCMMCMCIFYQFCFSRES